MIETVRQSATRGNPDPDADGDVRFVWLSVCALAMVAVVAYANSFSVPLILDDWKTVRHNPGIRQSWPLWSMFVPDESTGVGGRPVANITFVLNYALTGDSLAGFHAVNLGIQLGAGLALFGIVRRTLLLPGWRSRFGAEAGGLGLAVASLWMLHPLLTASVTYVSQRTESLMGLFYFLTLYGFVRAVAGSGTRRWLVVSVASCVCGMGSKEGMVTVPVMIFLYDAAFVGRSLAGAWRERWRYYLVLASTWLLLALLMRGVGGRGVGFGHGLSVGSNLLIECRAIVQYAALALWPWPLVFDYGTDLAAPAWFEAGCAVAVGASGLGVLFAFRRAPARAFFGAWFLVTLAPTSSVVPIPLQPIAENRVYVPLAAVLVAVVFGAYSVIGRRAVVAWLAGVVALTGLTLARNSVFRSEISVWADTVAKRPDSSRARNNLGQAWLAVGRLAEARAELEAALKIKPDYADAHANLASVFGQYGIMDTALIHARRAVQHDPRNASAHYNLGVTLAQVGDRDGAIAAYESAVRLQPHFPPARGNLGILLLRAGRTEEAVRHCEAALQGDASLVDARFSFACGLAMMGRAEAALPQFREVIRRRPGYADAHQVLGMTLTLLGRNDEAAAAFEAVLRIDPESKAAREALQRLPEKAPPTAPR